MTEKAPIVYVVQEPQFKDPNNPGHYKTLDLLPATDYGTVEVILEPGAQVMFNAAPAVRRLKAKLQHYRDCDYVMAAGDPVAIGIGCSLAALANRGCYTLLKWDRKERKYYPVRVNLLEVP